MVRIPTTKSYMKNLEKYECKFGEDPCVVCGKPVSRPYSYSIIEGNGGGYAVTAEEDRKKPNASMGEQPVGSDCWKKFPQLHPYYSNTLIWPEHNISDKRKGKSKK